MNCFTKYTAILLISVLSGCSFLNEHETTAKLATQYATIKIIDGDVEKAARVEEIATEVRKLANDDALPTVDFLIAAIRNEIRWHRLDAADELLVNALLDQLRAELVARLGSDLLPEDLRLAVDTVAKWVIDAARMT